MCKEHNVDTTHIAIYVNPNSLIFGYDISVRYKNKYMRWRVARDNLKYHKDLSYAIELEMDKARPFIKEIREEQLIEQLAGI